MEPISWSDFARVELRVGRVLDAQPFPEARKPAYVLQVDFGPELGMRKSSAQITDLYTPEELVGRLVVAVVNFPKKQIGPLMSECLVTGFHNEKGEVALCVPDPAVPLEPSFFEEAAAQRSSTSVPDFPRDTQIIIDLFAACSCLVRMLSRCSTSPHSTLVSQAPHMPSWQLWSVRTPAASTASRIDTSGVTSMVRPERRSSTLQVPVAVAGASSTGAKRSMCAFDWPSTAQASSNAASIGAGPQQ